MHTMTIAEARRRMRARGIQQLLTDPVANPKVAKGLKYGVMTSPLHLAPARLSGYEVCPKASPGCREACLHTAGNPAYLQKKQKARINKTRFYFEDRSAFLIVLAAEIAALEKKARLTGMQPAVRLNATSDIPWERIQIPHDAWWPHVGLGYGWEDHAPNIMEVFPNVEFYDYTKITKRIREYVCGGMPSNYYLVLSATEDNQKDVREALTWGASVAMVFEGKVLPHGYVPDLDVGTHQYSPVYVDIDGGKHERYEVVDGDISDYLVPHQHRPGYEGKIIGLHAKGKARQDNTGFVRAIK